MRSLHLIERISALVRSELRRTAAEDALEPVHVLALDYLARANAFSNHPLAVAEYLGLTKGNMSQRLNVLERQKLIRKVADAEDGRRVHLELTRQGSAVLARNYPPRAWPRENGERLEAGLEHLLRRMVANNHGRTFGECRTCRFHKSQDGPYCGLLELRLTEIQARQICREHEPS